MELAYSIKSLRPQGTSKLVFGRKGDFDVLSLFWWVGGWVGLVAEQIPLSTKPIHAEKNCLRELIWACLTEGAPKKIVWGINLGIGS